MFRPAQALVLSGLRKAQPSLLKGAPISKPSFRSSLQLQKSSINPSFQFARTTGNSLRFFSDDAKKESESQEEAKPESDVSDESSAKVENETVSADEALQKAEEEKKELEEKLSEMKKEVQYALAEIENTRVRGRNDVEKARKYAIQSFAKQLLDVADNLHRAVDSVPKDDLKKEDADHHLVSLFEGVEMTQSELQKVLKANGITEFGEEGEQFDPNFHEAMFQAPDETKEPNTISIVLKTGYKFQDRVIRPAQVGTVQKP